MRTRADRIDLVHNIVAGLVSAFADPRNRGENWTLDSMDRMITDTITVQASINGIAERHHEQMIQDGQLFYNRHLRSVLVRVL